MTELNLSSTNVKKIKIKHATTFCKNRPNKGVLWSVQCQSLKQFCLSENQTDVYWCRKSGQWNSSRSSSQHISRSTQLLQPPVWRGVKGNKWVACQTACKRKLYQLLKLEGIVLRCLGDQCTNWYISSHHYNVPPFWFLLLLIASLQHSLIKMQKSFQMLLGSNL